MLIGYAAFPSCIFFMCVYLGSFCVSEACFCMCSRAFVGHRTFKYFELNHTKKSLRLILMNIYDELLPKKHKLKSLGVVKINKPATHTEFGVWSLHKRNVLVSIKSARLVKLALWINSATVTHLVKQHE